MKQNLVFLESTQWMEAKCAKMHPMGSELTEALKNVAKFLVQICILDQIWWKEKFSYEFDF